MATLGLVPRICIPPIHTPEGAYGEEPCWSLCPIPFCAYTFPFSLKKNEIVWIKPLAARADQRGGDELGADVRFGESFLVHGAVPSKGWV
jgi:hypothetical protein